MRLRFPGLVALAMVSLFALTACESAEERANRHYEAAMALLEEGDVSRAIVEFRNVFELNPKHKEARMAYARTQLERGRRGDAYAQYLKVVEQYPDMLEPRIELAEMAIEGNNWDEARRHVTQGLKQAPDDPKLKVAKLALDYTDAIKAEDQVAIDAVFEAAQAALKEQPDNFTARRMVIDTLVRKQNLDAVIPVIDEGLEQRPDSYQLYMTKARLQVTKGDMAGAGDTLRAMVEAFPDDETARHSLISWYIGQGDNEGAERFLRELAARPEADDGSRMAVVQFLRTTEGIEAARAEIERLIETLDEPERFISLRATMDFEKGDTDKAISDLEALTENVEEPDEVTNHVKILLARMHNSTSNAVAARALVEEVLESDNSHVAALKMRAAWLIDEDKTGDAIIDLRTALSQSPRDPSIMTLMAAAHERAGDRELAGERYALAVELSENAPAESLRYANYLTSLERAEAAESVLSDALQKTPDNMELLNAMAALQIRKKDWNEVQRIVWKLRAIEAPEAQSAANGIQAEMMLQQDRVDETISYLEQLSEEEGGQAAFTAMIQTQVRAGKIDEAVKIVETRLAEKPEDPVLRNMRAGLYLLNEERDEAEAIYRALLTEFPANDQVLRTLYSLLMASDREDEARQLIDEQIALLDQNPKAVNALLLKAEILERDRDFEGAIAVYEGLYKRDSNNIVVANNLASLISAHRDTPESLERAYEVARRLRGIEVPALQDTYGWIEYRRGNYDEALSHLEPAAKGLPNDPLVQYHLGRAYLALEKNAEAKKTLEGALEIAGENPLPQLRDLPELLKSIPATE